MPTMDRSGSFGSAELSLSAEKLSFAASSPCPQNKPRTTSYIVLALLFIFSVVTINVLTIPSAYQPVMYPLGSETSTNNGGGNARLEQQMQEIMSSSVEKMEQQMQEMKSLLTQLSKQTEGAKEQSQQMYEKTEHELQEMKESLLASLKASEMRASALLTPTNNSSAKAVVANHANSTNLPHDQASGPLANLRTLVIVHGNLRGGEIPWRTLKENVLDYNPNTDLAVMVGDPVDPQYRNSSLFQWAKYNWKFREYDDWGIPMDEAFGTEWRETVLAVLNGNHTRRILGNLLGGIKGANKGSGAVMLMMRYWLHQKIQENDLIHKYDQFVVTRPDHYYLCPMDLSVLDTNKFMYVPKGEDWGGIQDRHFVAGKKDVLTALDWFPHIMKHYEAYNLTQNLGTEHVLKKLWQLTGLWDRLKRTDRDMFIAMNGNGADQTRTYQKQMRTEGPQGTIVKYRSEYNAAQRTCAAAVAKQAARVAVS